jgi:diguanylate cyclase (GGDEF)-like protein/PAS domain S-box-containing protein
MSPRTPFAAGDDLAAPAAQSFPPAIRDLLSGTVRRLGATAAVFVPASADIGFHGVPDAPEQALLVRALGELRPLADEVLATDAARYVPLPRAQRGSAAAVALVPVCCVGDEPLGCLMALSSSGWPGAERIALVCMAEAAAAEAARAEEAATRQRAEHRVKLLEGALRAANIGVTIADERGRIVYANPAEARMHGYEVEELYGREARSLAPPELWSPDTDLPRRTRHWTRERTNVRSDGTRFPVRLCSDPIVDDTARPVGLVTWCEDLTGRTSPEAPEAPAAGRDALTGTLDRAAFLHRLRLACAAREEGTGEDFTLLFIDLDRFKAVNDRHGHAAGDALLSTLGRRLVTCVRPTDAVGRVGGDEFAVLLRGTGREAEVVPVVHRIQRTLAAAATAGAVEIHPSASIGIALGSDCETPEDLLAIADRAMYRAKALGPGHYGAGDAALRTHDSAVGALEADLRHALDHDELALRFQPIISLSDGRLAGFEALVRWDHPVRGLLGPQAFLPVAERSNLIVDIDRWVLRAAARQMRDWASTYPAAHPISMSVNFSGRHVVRPDVADHTRAVLREFGVGPGRLTVEVTETSMVEDAEAAASTLTHLREGGIRLALDDFGTGYSSLSYLRQLPFDVLKIDRSFVQRVGQSASDRAIVRSVVALARTLGLSVTAEGVETAEQQSALRRLDCEHGQGFLFSEPVTAAEAAGWIERGAHSFPGRARAG